MIRDAFLATQGIHNFRDYGGWPTEDGGSVRRGLLFRSGQHVGATDADLAAIAALDIRTVVDLRGESERDRNPCRRVEGWNGEVVFYEGETSSTPPHMDVDPGTTTGEVMTSLAVLTGLYAVLAVVEVGLLLAAIRSGAEPFSEPPDPSRSPSDEDTPMAFAY